MKRLAGFALVAALVACGGGERYRGNAEIVKHEYDDADNEWVPGYQLPQQCSGGYGSVPRTCVPGVYIPGHMNHRPERFILHVKWVDDEGKRKTGEYEVPREAYDDCADGRTINLKSMKCPPR